MDGNYQNGSSRNGVDWNQLAEDGVWYNKIVYLSVVTPECVTADGYASCSMCAGRIWALKLPFCQSANWKRH
jgi:hypothetical protein